MGTHCKYCDTPLVAIFPSKETCEPGGGVPNTFLILLATFTGAGVVSGFEDKVIFSLGGGILVWILALELLYIIMVIFYSHLSSMIADLPVGNEKSICRGYCCQCVHLKRGPHTPKDRFFLWSCKSCRVRQLDGPLPKGILGRVHRQYEEQFLRRNPAVLIGAFFVVIITSLTFVTLTKGKLKTFT